MLPELIPDTNYFLKMADGTIKQVNPFTGTEVWTVPGRANRPLNIAASERRKLDPAKHDDHCLFCAKNYLRTPPEKARVVKSSKGYETLRYLGAENMFDTVAEFHRVPNLFEIVSYDYWQKNFNYTLSDSVEARKRAYLATDKGRQHVLDILDNRMRMAGMDAAAIAKIPVADRLEMANGFFGGGHELIIGRRHYVDGAEYDDQLASSGMLTPEEHYQYMRLTIDAARDIYLTNRYVRYVTVFQNWLKPAGASFDHLHKQLVAIDERGVQNEVETRLARSNPNVYNEAAVNFAVLPQSGLRRERSCHRLCRVRPPGARPWRFFPRANAASRGTTPPKSFATMSDIIHACHAAMGPDIPCNEEWYYKPPDADVRPCRGEC